MLFSVRFDAYSHLPDGWSAMCALAPGVWSYLSIVCGLASGPVAARVVPASTGPDLLSARMNEIVGASEQRQWEIVRDVQNEWNRSFRALKQEVNGLKQEVVLMQSGGGR